MKDIKISVILPIYNAEMYLSKCINSLLNQTFKEFEIIAVNDGSTDSSYEILKKFSKQDERIIIIEQKNQGVSVSRNIALMKAKGKYCINVDADDWIEENYLKDMYEKAEKNNLDIVVSDIYFDYLEDVSKNKILKDLDISNNEVILGEEYITIFLDRNFHGYTGNKMIRKQLYVENNLSYDKKISILEDTELFLRLLKYCNRIGKINKSYYHYLQHASISKTQKKEKYYNSIYITFLSLESLFSDNRKLQEKIYLWEIRHLLLGIFYLDKIKQKNFLLHIKKIPIKYLFYSRTRILTNKKFMYIFLLKICPSINLFKLIKYIRNTTNF